MSFDAAAALLEEIAEGIRLSLRSGLVSPERQAGMRDHLRRFVDQEALYRVRTEDQLAVYDYIVRLLRAHSQAEAAPSGSFLAADDDPTDPAKPGPPWRRG